jgi:hypothetical protein
MVVLVALAVSGSAVAQDSLAVSVSLLGGIGGSLDADPGDGMGNTAYQVALSVPTELGAAVSFRAGRVVFDDQEFFGSLRKPDLDFANIGGEYRFHEGYYMSSLYLGLGAYRLSGESGLEGLQQRDETAPGLVFGVTADFPISKRFSFLMEVAGHYVRFDDAQFFATALGGLVIRF